MNYKKIALLLIVLATFFFIKMTSGSANIEVETYVAPKMDCLSDNGAEISTITYGNNNDVGGKVTMDIKDKAFANEYMWTGESRIIEVGVYSKSWQTLKAINYRLYTKYGDVCTGSIENVDTSKASAEFTVTFNESIWVYFEVTGVDTSRSGNIGKEDRQIKVDKEPPEITDIKAEISEDRNLKITATVKDNYSGIDTVHFNPTSPSGQLTSYYSGVEDGDDGITKIYYRNIDLNTYGEGEYSITVYTNDTIPNVSETKKITLNTLDENGNKKTGAVGTNEETTRDAYTDEDYEKQKEQEKYPTAPATGNTGINIGTDENGNIISQKITCSNDLKGFINKIWKYFIIFGPILLIIMSTLDFFKAVFSSEPDMLNKAASNTVKRTLATIILLMLPLLLSTILDFFGLKLCL